MSPPLARPARLARSCSLPTTSKVALVGAGARRPPPGHLFLTVDMGRGKGSALRSEPPPQNLASPGSPAAPVLPMGACKGGRALGLGWKSSKTHDGNPSATKTPKFGCQKGSPKPLAPMGRKGFGSSPSAGAIEPGEGNNKEKNTPKPHQIPPARRRLRNQQLCTISGTFLPKLSIWCFSRAQKPQGCFPPRGWSCRRAPGASQSPGAAGLARVLRGERKYFGTLEGKIQNLFFFPLRKKEEKSSFC